MQANIALLKKLMMTTTTTTMTCSKMQLNRLLVMV